MGMKEDLFGGGYKQPINQKQKGNKNELHVCKLLTLWTGSEFARVPMSGGLRWQNVMNICGDVLSTDPSFDFPYVVETKDLSKLHITFDLRKNSEIYTIWKQVKRDSLRAERLPILMLRKTGERPRDKYTIFLVQTPKLLAYLISNNVLIVSMGDGIVGVNSINLFKNVDYPSFNRNYRLSKGAYSA
jgi:hypothetical protein